MDICVYCSASNALPEAYFAEARALGNGIAHRGWSLVYGGGGMGLMGTVADAVRINGGRVLGVIPQALLEREVVYLEAHELIITTTMRERKRIMDERASAFIALPGGFGTLEELLEIMTLRQLAYHNKPIIIVNIAGYFDALLAQFDRIFREGFAHSRYHNLFTVVENGEAALTLLADHYLPPTLP